jgi:hypothetical protein
LTIAPFTTIPRPTLPVEEGLWHCQVMIEKDQKACGLTFTLKSLRLNVR